MKKKDSQAPEQVGFCVRLKALEKDYKLEEDAKSEFEKHAGLIPTTQFKYDSCLNKFYTDYVEDTFSPLHSPKKNGLPQLRSSSLQFPSPTHQSKPPSQFLEELNLTHTNSQSHFYQKHSKSQSLEEDEDYITLEQLILNFEERKPNSYAGGVVQKIKYCSRHLNDLQNQNTWNTDLLLRSRNQNRLHAIQNALKQIFTKIQCDYANRVSTYRLLNGVWI